MTRSHHLLSNGSRTRHSVPDQHVSPGLSNLRQTMNTAGQFLSRVFHAAGLPDADRELVDEFIQRCCFESVLILEQAENGLRLGLWKVAGQRGSELLNQQRGSLRPTPAMADRKVHRHTPRCASVIKKYLDGVGDGVYSSLLRGGIAAFDTSKLRAKIVITKFCTRRLRILRELRLIVSDVELWRRSRRPVVRDAV